MSNMLIQILPSLKCLFAWVNVWQKQHATYYSNTRNNFQFQLFLHAPFQHMPQCFLFPRIIWLKRCTCIIQNSMQRNTFVISVPSSPYVQHRIQQWWIQAGWWDAFLPHTTILQPTWILSWTTRVSRHQKGKTRKVIPMWIYWSKR